MLKRTSWLGPLVCLLASSLTGVAFTGMAYSEPAWTTYHRDAERSGDDPDATQPIAPTLAWQTENLGAPIWGQPLVLGSHLYVATVGDEIYELNATTGAVEWQQSAGTPVPSGELPCGDIAPTVGIVSTPLIDTTTDAIYAVADTWNAGTKEAEHLLEGFNLQTGALVLSTPVDPPRADAKTLLQRSALNLDEGDIVFGFGGNFGSCSEELAPVVAVSAGGRPARFWQTHGAVSPTTAGGLWATGGAAVDGSGNIYVATANPLPPEGEPITGTNYDYSDSVVKLALGDFVEHPKEEPLTQLGWFEPPDWEFLSNSDLDLGSAGPEPLPGGLLFQAGKHGGGYLIDEATMGSGAAAVYNGEVCGGGGGSFGGDSYADGTIYIPCTNGVQALAYDEPARTFTPLWQGPEDAFGSPIVSGGSVWVMATGGFSGGGTTLYGLDPSTGVPRYTETLPSPVADHFASPSAAGGRLFVATGSSVTAYQIAQLPAGATVSPSTKAPASKTGAKASNVPTLLQRNLRAGPKGRVRVALRCPAAAGKCKGTVTLIAEIATIVHRGKRRVRRVVAIRLARARFGPHKGQFTVTIQLGRSAEGHLRRHHDRLTVQVVIASAGGKARRVTAVLT
jgi:outer membrane protein assembly factor BamB